MKKTTLKRLSQYTALSAAVVGVADATCQESGPTPLNLDISGTVYELDMDGDGTIEFELDNLAAASFLSLKPKVAGAEALGFSAMSNGNTFIYPFALNSGADISAGATQWFNDNYQTMVGSSLYPYTGWGNGINPVENKYLGLRFNISGETHYGWAKFSHVDVETEPDVSGNIILESYYYNPNSEDPIQAGQTKPLSVRDNVFMNLKVITNNKTITLLNLINKTNYSVYDIGGRLILNGLSKNKTENIKLRELSSGIFILKLMDEKTGDVMSKKILMK